MAKTRERSRPPRWSMDQIVADCQRSESLFISRWWNDVAVRRAHYQEHETSARLEVEALLADTADLTSLSAGAFVGNKKLAGVLRFAAAPFVSEDDLKTLAGFSKGPTSPLAKAERVISVASAALDSLRFPWVSAGRRPSPSERSAAILATAALIATERFRTGHRNSASREQEQLTSDTLTSAGYLNWNEGSSVAQLPAGFFFPGSVTVAGTRCDRLARLLDGRLLAVECKVSNSSVNSFKRLNEDTVSKAEKWRVDHGKELLPVAVLAGVFKPQNVLDAQDNHGLFVVWAHDMSSLETFARLALMP